MCHVTSASCPSSPPPLPPSDPRICLLYRCAPPPASVHVRTGSLCRRRWQCYSEGVVAQQLHQASRCSRCHIGLLVRARACVRACDTYPPSRPPALQLSLTLQTPNGTLALSNKAACAPPSPPLPPPPRSHTHSHIHTFAHSHTHTHSQTHAGTARLLQPYSPPLSSPRPCSSTRLTAG